MSGKLSVCPTPIGNLHDITIRVLNTIKEADLIAAEDTRHTLKLLNFYEIQKPLTSYHEHNKNTKGLKLIEKIRAGDHVVLVSDAGTPGISDPGADLVRLCIDYDIPFEVLPGATAFTTALAASGLNTERFSFEGFLHRDKKNRKKRLELIAREDRTLIFYESPHRLNAMLQDALEVLGDRKMVFAREITKHYEEIRRGTISEIINYYKEKPPKGEFVIMVEGITEDEIIKQQGNEFWAKLSIQEHIRYYLEKELDKKEAVKKVAKERGIPKREVYDESIDL
ncbi:MAG: 16S rRNA (cytidine(1402)-2'-O)-methyltransferase [Alkaliphilus sp.]|nr:16S rRNA (cytidine(1402)-2'-O)-methyltransferase [Alkaliphilus sp.]